MENILNFFIEVGKLKGKERRGWQIHKIKKPETTAEHIFHSAILAWILGRDKKLNLEKVIKMALVHDICEIYSPDFTSYDAVGLKEKGKITIKDFLKIKPKTGRPTLGQRKKLEKIKKKLEVKAMKKLLFKLPFDLKKEIQTLWLDYENGLSPEGRFVKQVDKVTNLLQGLEYWQKYGKIQCDLWMRRAKEVLDDPLLVEFMEALDKKFLKKKNKKI